MKKLLFVISQLYKGGAETALLNLLSSLSSEDFEIDLLLLNQYPVKDAVSLVPEIPKHINVFDQWKKTYHFPLLYRLKRRLRYIMHGDLQDPQKAIQYVQNKVYDWAFHIGEWISPEFCAKHVRAANKAVWIHTDLSKSTNFNADVLFSYDKDFSCYIFVSQNAMMNSVEKFPQLKGRAYCIHNIVDDQAIKAKSEAFVPFRESLPVVVTCANIRPEKNHMRQIEVMTMLKEKGIRFKWLNLGSTADKILYEKLVEEVEKRDLSQDFLFLGSVENPYPYIKHATAVAVLSDYEAWSLVITEAKVLGVPVIATKTAGAMEQIEHNVTGILCEFDAEDIALKMENLLKWPALKEKIRENIAGFSSKAKALDDFSRLINLDINQEENRR